MRRTKYTLKHYALCVFFLVILLIAKLYAQDQKQATIFTIKGIVEGYSYDPAKKLLQKSKQATIEGTLENVKLEVFLNDKSFIKAFSNVNGEFSITLFTGKSYMLVVSKEGYSGLSLLIDTRAITKAKYPKGFTFSNVEFLLNSNAEKAAEVFDEMLGRLYYDESTGYMNFIPSEVRIKDTRWIKRGLIDNPSELFKKSVEKNMSIAGYAEIEEVKPKTWKVIQQTISTDTTPADSNYQLAFTQTAVRKMADTLKKIKLALPPVNHFDKIDNRVIAEQENIIEKAKEELKIMKSNATTYTDSLLIAKREAEIQVAEEQLKYAKHLIEAQKEKIQNQRILIYISAFTILLLISLSVLIFSNYKAKKRLNKLLQKQNKDILDSIEYAKKIQDSILIKPEQAQKLIPQLFIYFHPKDIVSGDFYWFAQQDDYIMVAAVDCTGHGVPGAFMTLIGNSILNNVVKIMKINDPGKILTELNKQLTAALQQQGSITTSDDGMELALCVINKKQNKISFACSVNPAYIIINDKVTMVPPDVFSIGGSQLSSIQKEIEFTTNTYDIVPNMAVYMFTDGIPDQFGGPENKKFHSKQLKTLLKEIASKDLVEQHNLVSQAIDKWKGNIKQTDDMLLIGFKL